jgi:hypothetical protein
MSSRSFVFTLAVGVLFMSGAALHGGAATRPESSVRTPATDAVADNAVFRDQQGPALTCSEILCHSTAECSAGTTPCGTCVIPPGGFFGHCSK